MSKSVNYNKPILKFHIRDRYRGEGNFVRDGIPCVYLLFDYKLETFDD